ncbi:SCEL protein, partial [Peucedramus taeniatus]|nr:SCEL protein [Peucedramus taeniatus]
AAPSSEQVTPQKSETDVDNQATARNQDLNNLSKGNPSSFTSDKEAKDLSDLTKKNTADQKNKRDEDLGDHTEVKSADDQSTKRIIEKAYESPPRAPKNLPEINYSSDRGRKTSKSSLGAHEETITGNTIKTVYSTSDRSIIGKDICTYCRKPLGIDAKMILDALQIYCHSTCFKCEVCKRPLEDLKAGDSIWIYKQTVHCEPCYSKVKEEWIY